MKLSGSSAGCGAFALESHETHAIVRRTRTGCCGNRVQALRDTQRYFETHVWGRSLARRFGVCVLGTEIQRCVLGRWSPHEAVYTISDDCDCKPSRTTSAPRPTVIDGPKAGGGGDLHFKNYCKLMCHGGAIPIELLSSSCGVLGEYLQCVGYQAHQPRASSTPHLQSPPHLFGVPPPLSALQ